MIYCDYKYVGSKMHIKARFGDGQGTPYKGPIKVKFLNRNTMAILSKDSAISLQNLRGSIDFVFHSLSNREATDKCISDKLDEIERDRDNWQQKFLAKETNESNFSNDTPYAYIDSNGTDLVVTPGSDIFITDSYGKFGGLPEEFSAPTAIDCFTLLGNTVICSCDAGSSHRLQIFDHSFRLICSIGGMGPLDGQFRDPVSVSAHLPYQFHHHHGTPLETTRKKSLPTPLWFRGECSRDELEDDLYDETLQGNFLVARRPLPRGSPETYDILHLTNAKALRHVLVQKDVSIAGSPFFIANQGGAGAETRYFESLWDLVRAQRHYMLGDDPRPYALVAVADRRNFRVQVFRYFWTSSELFAPGIEVAHVIGGIHNRFVRLVDPVSVAYSPSCELAICDSGSKSVLLLSESMDLIKCINLLYVSPRDLRLIQTGKGVTIEAQSKTSRSDNEDKSSKVTLNSSDGATNKPCSVAFNQMGNLAVGYKNGGVYVYEAYKAYEVGHFKKLQAHVLERIILSYLNYTDTTTLRNCCNCLHNFTREMRLAWKLFPGRSTHINQVVFLFVRWSRIGVEGVQGVDQALFPLLDREGKPMCLRHMNRECPASDSLNLLQSTKGWTSTAAAGMCRASHGELCYDVEELSALDAYVELVDLMFFASVLFGPKFIWIYEVYIRELFVAFGEERLVCSRRDSMTRKNEVVRETVAQMTRVLLFRRYLELMTVLQEQHSELKELHAHKLFYRCPRSRFHPTGPLSLQAVDPRLVPDPTEQYDRNIDVPHKSIKGPHYVTKRGLEKAERHADSAIREHVETFRSHTEQVASGINSLFM